MSYVTRTYWVDDDVVAEDGDARVVLRPDEDATLDGDYLPILVRANRHGVSSCTGEHWYSPNDAVRGDDEAFARAVEHFASWRGFMGRSFPNLLERWVRLYLGGSGVIQVSTPDDEFFACDSAALRKLWGLLPSMVYGKGGLSDYSLLRAFFDGEVYGYVVQTRDEGGEWADTDDSCWGLIGREHAENSAREAFLVMKIRASRGGLTSATGLR